MIRGRPASFNPLTVCLASALLKAPRVDDMTGRLVSFDMELWNYDDYFNAGKVELEEFEQLLRMMVEILEDLTGDVVGNEDDLEFVSFYRSQNEKKHIRVSVVGSQAKVVRTSGKHRPLSNLEISDTYHDLMARTVDASDTGSR